MKDKRSQILVMEVLYNYRLELNRCTGKTLLQIYICGFLLNAKLSFAINAGFDKVSHKPDRFSTQTFSSPVNVDIRMKCIGRSRQCTALL